LQGAGSRHSRLTFLLLIILMVFSHGAAAQAVAAPREAREIPAAARRTIGEANAEWLRAMKRGDAVAIAAPYADDAVFVTSSGESVRGRESIVALMRGRLKSGGRAIDGEIVQDGLAAVGGKIYEWGHASLKLARENAAPTAFKGRYLTVWAPDSAGHWRIVRNLSLPY
jgi:ketosteroid isomerase-like protein